MTVTTNVVHPGMVFERTDELATAGHEQVVFCRDTATGLQAIIAIHDTTLGPSLGGTRMYPYADEAAALTDVLRLSRSMTFKSAAAGLDLGGGKAVIIGDPSTKTEDLLLSYGRFIDSLGGRYYAAADVNTTSADLDIVARATPYVVGTESRGSGDSGGSTAEGVYHAMRSACEHVFGRSGLAGRTIGVEGVGKVGAKLVGLLVEAGVARILISDPRSDALDTLSEAYPDIVSTAPAVIDANVDVYAPCALGGTVTTHTAENVNAKVICGGANNQLADESVVHELQRRNILWVPDYIANAGGVIQVGSELVNATPEQVRGKVRDIAATVDEVLARSRSDKITTSAAAEALVLDRLDRARQQRPATAQGASS